MDKDKTRQFEPAHYLKKQVSFTREDRLNNTDRVKILPLQKLPITCFLLFMHWDNQNSMMLCEVKQVSIHKTINTRGWLESIAIRSTLGWQKRKHKNEYYYEKTEKRTYNALGKSEV